MPRTADRCKETTTSTGTSAITLAGAVTQFQSFATAFGSGSTRLQYAIVGQTGTEWETGYGTFNGTSTLVRDSVVSSSNSNALVNFSAGTKDVFATVIAEHMEHSTVGQLMMHAYSMALP